MNMSGRQSIRQKLMRISMLVVCSALLLAGVLLIAAEIISFRRTLIERIGVTAEMIGTNTTASLTFNDSKSAEETLSSLKSAQNITCAVLYDSNGEVLAQYTRDAAVAGTDCRSQATGLYDYHMGLNYLDVFHRITFDNKIIGTLHMKSDLSEIYRRIKWYGVTIFAVMMLSIVAAFLIMSRLSKIIIRPLSEMTQVMLEISQSRDYSARVDIQSHDELGLLGGQFNDMLLQIHTRDTELALYRENLEQLVATRTEELYKTLDELKHSQQELILSAKMASLGQLVAGVAHEINTPVGIAFTLSSNILKKSETIVSAFNDKSLSKSQLEDYINDVEQNGQLIYRNLQRTADLIRSFKMVAADQVTQERRTFRVKEYIEEILFTLQPKLKHYQLNIELTCSDITLDSYPGAFAQIITNLIMNSLMHAYEPAGKGNISIKAVEIEGEIIIEYRDDGKGISQENLMRVFDPFFTTKRGAGGTGLGLHIVFNIVTHTLGGHAECKSTEGEGAAFIIKFPVRHGGLA
ncbi:MAG: ATP-binding protein [Candidatus Magnetominusculus sp. LBB02]|nr:ATP-binding protein [Candidatus Magnetominusculus sp. LBB02]